MEVNKIKEKIQKWTIKTIEKAINSDPGSKCTKILRINNKYKIKIEARHVINQLFDLDYYILNNNYNEIDQCVSVSYGNYYEKYTDSIDYLVNMYC